MLFFWPTQYKKNLKVKVGQEAKSKTIIAVGQKPKEQIVWDIIAENPDLSYSKIEAIFKPLLGKEMVQGSLVWQQRSLFKRKTRALKMPQTAKIISVANGQVILAPFGYEKVEYRLNYDVAVDKEEKDGIWCRVETKQEVEISWLTEYNQNISLKGYYFGSDGSLTRTQVEDKIVVLDKPDLLTCLSLQALGAKGIIINASRSNPANCLNRLKQVFLVQAKQMIDKKLINNNWLILNKNK